MAAKASEQSQSSYLNRKSYCIKCRLCRTQLITSETPNLSLEGKTKRCGNCIFLDEDVLPDWITHEIQRSSWTKGRLKCHKRECTARVGGFDFIQGISCACGKFHIPAIWLQDCKVDVTSVDCKDFSVTDTIFKVWVWFTLSTLNKSHSFRIGAFLSLCYALFIPEKTMRMHYVFNFSLISHIARTCWCNCWNRFPTPFKTQIQYSKRLLHPCAWSWE